MHIVYIGVSTPLYIGFSWPQPPPLHLQPHLKIGFLSELKKYESFHC